MKQKIALAIHGGAGTILKSKMTAALEKAYKEALRLSLQKGYDVLTAGGTSLDAVETAVRELEDCPLYNAGKGAVFTADGRNEMDASIMSGKDLAAGAIAGVTCLKNPVTAARAVMEKSDHVMLIGSGAEAFARLHGIEMVAPDYYFTRERWEALLKIREEDPDRTDLDHGSSKSYRKKKKEEKFGTVGAVALDREGNLAAATSTGGMTNKKWGRVGDSPVIGAGTYANRLCAVSCTGWGEYFLRLCVAKTVADLMEYKGYSLLRAANEAILKKLPEIGGDGGLVAVDAQGAVALPFNTEGMYRGYVKNNGKIVVDIYA
ncbi:isoaspartyl peptidase/L-asparaginase family protein [Flavisolibacter nicotianae]|uniref:isoaspartyl peptidase/L-asparaginase family protein n=1 Tax=Flavisolibacter nicotianae TaxID=2364882 RepID=UPI000EB453C0|nr:isoaspartyl peptidase/L-asparaginase [Flavisolibacter nicotianae]